MQPWLIAVIAVVSAIAAAGIGLLVYFVAFRGENSTETPSENPDRPLVDCYACMGVDDCRKTQTGVSKCANHEYANDPTCEGGAKCAAVPDGFDRIVFHNGCSEEGTWATVTTESSSQTAFPMNGVTMQPRGAESALIPTGTWNGITWFRSGCNGDFTQCDCNCTPDPSDPSKCIDHNVSFACSQVEFNNLGSGEGNRFFNYNVSQVNAFRRSYAVLPDPFASKTGDCELSGGMQTETDETIIDRCPADLLITEANGAKKCMSNCKRCAQSDAPASLNCNGEIEGFTANNVWCCDGPLATNPTTCANINRTSNTNAYFNYMKPLTPNSYTFAFDDEGGQSGFSTCTTRIMHVVACPLPTT